ncbi:MAG: hypothetical protein WCJ91_03670 [Actinomycetes bacterium]|jgi:heme/copper-type cytochrome/quinol oxidase subunit 3
MSTSTEHVMHHDAPEAVGRRERLGVRLIIVADGSFVFALIFSYFYLRNLNVAGGWFPKDAHLFTVRSGWLLALPFVVAAISHRIGQRNRANLGTYSIITFLALAIGLVMQWNQLSHMPFMLAEEGGFEGSYASMAFLMGAANILHYVLGAFVALGLVIRTRRAALDPVLDTWRLLTAGSWFTWIAIAGIAGAITTSFVAL